jgi:hypothetical protein
MISDKAVEAAFLSMWGPNPSNPSDSGDAHLLKELRKALEAAAPYMIAPSRPAHPAQEQGVKHQRRQIGNPSYMRLLLCRGQERKLAHA